MQTVWCRCESDASWWLNWMDFPCSYSIRCLILPPNWTDSVVVMVTLGHRFERGATDGRDSAVQSSHWPAFCHNATAGLYLSVLHKCICAVWLNGVPTVGARLRMMSETIVWNCSLALQIWISNIKQHERNNDWTDEPSNGNHLRHNAQSLLYLNTYTKVKVLEIKSGHILQ